MHVAASSPQAIDESGLDKEIINKEPKSPLISKILLKSIENKNPTKNPPKVPSIVLLGLIKDKKLSLFLPINDPIK